MIITENFQIPSSFQLALTYSLDFNEQNDLLLASSYSANNSLEDLANFGIEYGFMNTFFVRGGYNFLVENSKEYIYGFTAGAGVNYNIGGQFGVVFDYAFRDVKDFQSANHIFTVKLTFD